MQQFGEGLVIYKPSRKYKAMILNQHTGLQEVSFGTHLPISIGSRITYVQTAKQGFHFVNSFKIEDMPLMVAKEDIFFLHYVCELVYSFMPVGKIIEGVYDQLLFLFSETVVVCIKRVLWKKYFIARLLFVLGIYSQEQEHCLGFLQIIARLPIDRIDTELLDLAVAEGVDRWLLQLFVTEPRLNELKTTYFVNWHRNI